MVLRKLVAALLVGLLVLPMSAFAQAPSGQRQVSRFDCGPAAVADQLTRFFGIATSESDIARLAGGEQSGATLRGLKRAVLAKGLEAHGYRFTVPQLLASIETLNAPVLIHLRQPAAHFALAIGKVGDKIVLADPTHGNVSLHIRDFERQFSGHTLVIASRRPTGTSGDTIREIRASMATRRAALSHAGAIGGVAMQPESRLSTAMAASVNQLSDAELDGVRGDGWVAVIAAGWATLGAVLTFAQLWEMHHRGHDHRGVYSEIHYWYGVPYMHLHHP